MMTGSGGLPEWGKREMTALAQDRDRQRARAEKWRSLADRLAEALSYGDAWYPDLMREHAEAQADDDG